jgi:hypothetical protein
MNQPSNLPELETDVRILRRDIAKGFVSPTIVHDMLGKLPDVEDQGEWFDPDTLGEEEEPEATDGTEDTAQDTEDPDAD